MPLVQKLKKNIRISLKKIINQNSFINDIWIYGNLSDQISDLDLIVVLLGLIKTLLKSSFGTLSINIIFDYVYKYLNMFIVYYYI